MVTVRQVRMKQMICLLLIYKVPNLQFTVARYADIAMLAGHSDVVEWLGDLHAGAFSFGK